MTISYQNSLGSVGLLGGFPALLCKWRGSLYKLCYRELICLLVPFFTLSAVYRLVLNEDQKRLFEKLVRYFDKYLNMIPLSFILGFYVTIIAQRWWQQFMALPWPDRLILAVVMYIPGSDNKSRLLRKTLIRQCNLMAVLVLRALSDSVQTRMKTTDDIVKAGFMTPAEKICYDAVQTEVSIYWLPSLWFTKYLQRALDQGQIKDTHGAKLIMEQFLEFRTKCGTLWSYGWVNIPLVYTQVVTLATYSFFIACILGRQHIDDGTDRELPADIYFPSWTVLQFFFYMGLLKVAEQMINPYGDDDEDFELNYLLDRHAEVTNLCTDLLTDKYPPVPTEDTAAPFSIDAHKRHIKKSAIKRKLSHSRTIISPLTCPPIKKMNVISNLADDHKSTELCDQVVSLNATCHQMETDSSCAELCSDHHIVDLLSPKALERISSEKIYTIQLNDRKLVPNNQVFPE